MLAFLLLIRNVQAAESPPPDPGAPAWPGGHASTPSLRNELLVVPRLVLGVPRLVVRALGWPLRWIFVVNQRYRVAEHVIGALTSADGLIGVRPVFDFMSGYGSLYGVSFFDRRILGPGTSLEARFAIGGPRRIIGALSFAPLPASRVATVEVTAAYVLRDDQVFRAIPSLTPPGQDQGNARYTLHEGDLWLRLHLRAPHGLSFVVPVQLGIRRFGDGVSMNDDPPISYAYCERLLTHCVPGTVDERLVPGFDRGTQFARVGAALHLNTFDRPAKPSAGVLMDLAAHYTVGLGEPSQYVSASAALEVAINLWQRSHILLLRARSELILPIGDGQVPFSELATLGGPGSMRGFRIARFRDYSSLILSAEYRWPIQIWMDGALFADYGGVAGRTYQGLGLDKLFPDVGAAIRVRTSRAVWLRFQVAYGFPDGTQVNFVLGADR